MSVPLKQRIEWLEAESEIDYIGLWQVVRAADEATDVDPALNSMERTLSLVAKLLDRGFRAVDLAEGGKCTPWADQDRASVLRRIEREWRASGDDPVIGHMIWFDRPDSQG